MTIRRAALVALGLALGLSACAPYASDISTRADQDHSANNDALMVFLIGVPTSGGGVKGQVADLKGQQIALHEAMIQAECR